MSAAYDCLIVGAGHAGAQAALALRQRGFAGTIGLLGDEPGLPYERPPLSKDYLAGERTADSLLLHKPALWDERSIDMLSGRRVVSVDPQARSVRCAEGSVVGYSTLIWAGGGSPRSLSCPGGDLPGVHSIRTLADVDRIRGSLAGVRTVAIVGGGYIGLEAAAILRGLGKTVMLVEAVDRVLARVAGEPLSRFVEAQHRARGVDIRCGASVARVEEAEGRAAGLRLGDGSVIAAELVITGIGITPAVDPLLAAGAEGDNGMRVDSFCRTSLPGVFAIGDCALHENIHAGGRWIRLESVQNANDQAQTAARAIVGDPAPYRAIPWFWSKQYDLHLQTVGLSLGHDKVVLRGDPDSKSFSLVYLRQGRVIALDCVNAARDYVQGRLLIEKGAAPSAAALADAGAPLKTLLPQ